jgi:hypothetical protein
MKNLLLCAVLLAPAAAAAESLESLRAGAADAFAQAPALVRPTLQAAAFQDQEPVLQPPLKPSPFRPSVAPGAVLARVNLASQLDRNLRVLNYKFGARPLDFGVATDSAFKKFFFTFSDRAGTTLGPIGDLNQLRGDGVDVRIDAATVYNFKVSINIFSPVRGSTLHMTATAGTSGDNHDEKTGAVLDAVRARATLMTLNGDEYWIFYGRDALPDGGGFAPTRSFLFVHMNGLSSKAWPLAEDSLKPDAAAVVDLGGTKISVTRASSGELIVNAAN